MTIWECEYCGEAVRNDEAGYNFFENRYFCDPDCAAKFGLDMNAEYDYQGNIMKDEYGRVIKENE